MEILNRLLARRVGSSSPGEKNSAFYWTVLKYIDYTYQLSLRALDFAENFEKKFLHQNEQESRTIEETLKIAEELLQQNLSQGPPRP